MGVLLVFFFFWIFPVIIRSKLYAVHGDNVFFYAQSLDRLRCDGEGAETKFLGLIPLECADLISSSLFNFISSTWCAFIK